MKKIFLAIIAIAASVFMVSCTKNGNGVSASIVGTWESTKAEASFTDKNGNTVTAKDIAVAVLKEEGIDESLIQDAQIDRMAETFAESAVEPMRIIFGADGTVKGQSKDKSGNWKDEEGTGTYKLEGNKLNLDAPKNLGGERITVTVLSLTATELKIQVDASSIGGEGASSEIEELGYNMFLTLTYKRV
ncbi:MAG: lipocalin family protein [Bacteroidales bacterium]|nr:lipocalin family protein [Bacteroidales bacterium]